MNRSAFFNSIRSTIFGGRLSQKQLEGCESLIDAWEADYSHLDLRYLAYCLATAKHETAATMQPIEEYGSDARAERLYGPTGKNPSRAKRMGNSNPGDGAKYKGRGYVQLTWKKNYRRAGKILGVDMEGNPDLALVPSHAARILFEGCLDGWFTEKKLVQYLNKAGTDYVNARRIVNGTDEARLIAGYAVHFEEALRKAAGDQTEAETIPDDKPMPVLRKGSVGPSVKALQGLLDITADGDFGPVTEKAVKAYQTRSGLQPDGIVGPATWASLMKD